VELAENRGGNMENTEKSSDRKFMAAYDDLRESGVALGNPGRSFREVRDDLLRRLKQSPADVTAEILDIL